MFEIAMQTYIGRLPLMVAPVILWLLLNIYHVYNKTDRLTKVKGLLLSLLTSFPVMYFFSVLLITVMSVSFRGFFSAHRPLMAILGAVIYTAVGIVLMLIYNRTTVRLCSKDEFISKNYCGYLYTEYIITVYMSMLVATNAWNFFAWHVFFTVFWFHIFKDELDFLKIAYPTELPNTSNVCILFDYIVILELWVMPSAVIDFSSQEMSRRVEIWIGCFALLIYAFSMVIHKIIVNDMRHRRREEFYMSSDELTGLANPRYFINKAQEALDYTADRRTEFSFVFIDIADFKYFNENHGRETGDYALEKIGRELQMLFGFSSGIGRLGDDHFVVMCVHDDDIEDKISALMTSLREDEKSSCIQLKVGIYNTDENDCDAAVAVEKAWRACKTVDIHEGGSISYFDATMDRRGKMEHYVVENIDRAIEQGHLQAYYQPIVDASTGELVAAESLVRWSDDEYGMIGPDIFIPVLESYNKAYLVDKFMIETICRGLRENQDATGVVYPTSVNVSRKDFFAMDVVAFVEECVEKYEIDRSLLKIEITESALVGDDGVVSNEVQRFREKGYEVWMDDFGCGMSSLNSIAELEVDGIKMDMVFLRNMSEKNCTLMRGMVKVAKEMGLVVTFEGVEEQEHFDFIREIGCDKAQGYFFSKPKPMSTYLTETK